MARIAAAAAVATLTTLPGVAEGEREEATAREEDSLGAGTYGADGHGVDADNPGVNSLQAGSPQKNAWRADKGGETARRAEGPRVYTQGLRLGVAAGEPGWSIQN